MASDMKFLDFHREVLQLASLLMDAHVCATKSISDPEVVKILKGRHLSARSRDALRELKDLIATHVEVLTDNMIDAGFLESQDCRTTEKDLADMWDREDEEMFLDDMLDCIEVTGFLIGEEKNPICVACMEKEGIVVLHQNKNGERFFGPDDSRNSIMGIVVPHKKGIGKCFICHKTFMGCRIPEPCSLEDLSIAARRVQEEGKNYDG